MALETTDSTGTRRLLEAVQHDDQRALDELFSRHRKYLRQAISLRLDRKTRARVDPSDVVQEAQLQAARRIRDYLDQPAMPFRLWLRQIAQDQLLMARRRHVKAGRRSVERELPLPEKSSMLMARQLMQGGPTPSQALAKKEAADKVRRAVTRLPESDREVVLMLNFEELTSTEAAQVLGIEPATVRKRYGRALLRLRQLFVEEGLQES